MPNIWIVVSVWLDGDINSLLEEGHAIQNHLSHLCSHTLQCDDQLAHKFFNLMMAGIVRAALRLLSDKGHSAGVLSLDSVVEGRSAKEILLDKHPSGQPVDLSTIVSPPQHSDSALNIQP